jgi:hypothetical protein
VKGFCYMPVARNHNVLADQSKTGQRIVALCLRMEGGLHGLPLIATPCDPGTLTQINKQKLPTALSVLHGLSISPINADRPWNAAEPQPKRPERFFRAEMAALYNWKERHARYGGHSRHWVFMDHVSALLVCFGQLRSPFRVRLYSPQHRPRIVYVVGSLIRERCGQSRDHNDSDCV